MFDFFIYIKLVLDLSSILVSGSYVTIMSLAYVIKSSFNFSTCHFYIISRMKATAILPIKKKIKRLPVNYLREAVLLTPLWVTWHLDIPSSASHFVVMS